VLVVILYGKNKIMKLEELIIYFRKGGVFAEFCQNYSLDVDAEVIEVYMQKPFSIDSDLAFFEIEKTEGNIEYFSDGFKYYNLFDFYYFFDMIDELKEGDNKKLSDKEVAERALSYTIKDA
jgi:hypothetical protein